jgi:cyclin-dependent kinase 2
VRTKPRENIEINETIRSHLVIRYEKHVEMRDLFQYAVQMFDHILSTKSIKPEQDEYQKYFETCIEISREVFFENLDCFASGAKWVVLKSLFVEICIELDFNFIYFPVILFFKEMNRKLEENVDIDILWSLFIKAICNNRSRFSYGLLCVSTYLAGITNETSSDKFNVYISVLSLLFDISEDTLKHCFFCIFRNEMVIQLSNVEVFPIVPNRRDSKLENFEYQSPNLIGCGSYSKVFEVEMKKKESEFVTKYETRAIKRFDNNNISLTDIFISLMVKHKNVVKTFGFMDDIPNKQMLKRIYNLDTFCIVQERCDIDLNHYIKKWKISPERIKTWSKQLLNGLEYLHNNNIIHRDIKPANILLKVENGNYVLKYADFGLSKLWFDDTCPYNNTKVVSVEYRPPELLEDKIELYSYSCDIWSLGCVFAEMMTGRVLFRPKHEYESFDEDYIRRVIRREITGRKVAGKNTLNIPELETTNELLLRFRDVIDRMLIVERDKRVTVDNLQKHIFYE